MVVTEVQKTKASSEAVGAWTIHSVEMPEQQRCHTVTFRLLEQRVPLREGFTGFDKKFILGRMSPDPGAEVENWERRHQKSCLLHHQKVLK